MNLPRILLQFFARLFISSNSLPVFLQYIVTFIQSFIFIILIASQSIHSTKLLIYKQHLQYGIIIFLVVNLVIRITSKASFVKGYYVGIVGFNMQYELGLVTVVVWVLLGLLVVVDVMSKIEFRFETQNPYSETLSGFVILHYIVMVTVAVLRFVQFDGNKRYIFTLCQFILFFILILVKSRSLCKNQTFKQLTIRFYFIIICYSLSQLLSLFISIPILYTHIFSLIISQLIYLLISLKLNPSSISIQQYISKKMQLEAGYMIFSKLYSKNQLQKQLYKGIRMLVNQDGNNLMEEKTSKKLKQNDKDKQRNHQEEFDTKELAYKLNFLLKNKNTVYSQILIAEICLFQLRQYVKCKHIIQSLLNKISIVNVIDYILIKKLQSRFLQQVFIQHQKCISPNFYQFIQNDTFRSLLIKSSIDFICLWQYTKVKQGIYKRLHQLTQRVILSLQKIKSQYLSLPTICIKTNLLYSSYLYNVQRNVEQSNRLLQSLYFYQQKQVCFDSDKKVFISLLLEKDEPVRVNKVGGNVNKLLGYERRAMVGLNINVLLPEFFKEAHEKMVNQTLELENDRLFLLKKNTILKNAKGIYQIVFICFRLYYNQQNQLFLQGFIKINPDTRHDWSNYLFVSQFTKQILQCSDNISEKLKSDRNKKYNVVSLFGNQLDNNFYKKIQYYQSQTTRYYYQPIMNLSIGQDQVTMFVKIQQFVIEQRDQSSEKTQNPQKRKLLISKMIKYPKYQIYDNIKYFLRRQITTIQTLNSIKLNLTVFFSIIIVTIFGIYITQIVSIIMLNTQYSSKLSTMFSTQKMVQHYMSMNKICLDLSYMTINIRHNYTYQKYSFQLRKNILILQQTNQYFKKYSIDKYEYQSLSQVKLYRKTYEFVSEMLAVASVIDTLGRDNEGLKVSMVNAFNQIFTETFLYAYTQYQLRMKKQLIEKSQTRQIQQISFITVIFILSFIMYVLNLKIQKQIRLSQFQTLKFIGGVTFQEQMIDKCKEFLFMVTEEKIEQLANLKQVKYGGNSLEKNQINKLGEMSARENTGRELMGSMSGRDSARETWRSVTNQQLIKQQNNNLTQQFPIKLKSANKLFVILPLILLLSMVALQISNYVINQKLKQINESQSSHNIIRWMNKPLSFTKILSAYLTQDRNSTDTDHDSTFYYFLSEFNSQYNSIATFEEISYSQFTQFGQLLRKIRFEYICTYTQCPQQDKQYINIIYTTTMQKLSNYMKDNYNFLSNPSNKLSTILNTQQIFRNVMIQLIGVYMKNYKKYAQNYMSNQLGLIVVIFVINTIVLGLFIVFGYVNLLNNIRKHFQIVEIVKVQSYQIDKEKLISFRQEEKQKTINLNKKKNKNKKKKYQDNNTKDDNQEDIIEKKQQLTTRQEQPRQKNLHFQRQYRRWGQEKQQEKQIN